MKLSEFIAANVAQIIRDWEAFARTQLPAAARMSDLALRNDAEHILEAIAHDIDTSQSPTEQY